MVCLTLLMAAPNNNKKMISLKSSDEHVYEVEEEAIMQSQVIKRMIEDGCADNVNPLPNVEGKVLEEVIEFCNKHAEKEKDGDALKAWDDKFMDVDHITLRRRLMAANYLEVKLLLDMCTQRAADMIKGKTVEQVRQTFGIKNDFTPEEEEKYRMETQWAFK